MINAPEGAKIIRSTLLLAGVLFHKRIDTTINFENGFVALNCRTEDLGDLRRMGLGSATDIKPQKNSTLLRYSAEGIAAGFQLLATQISQAWERDRQTIQQWSNAVH